MKNKYIIGVLAFLLGFITCLVIIKPKISLSTGDLSKNSGMSDELIKAMSLEWTKKAKICDLGYYKIAVPADGKNNAYFLWTKKGPVILSHDNLSLILFDQTPRNGSSKIILTLQDRGGKGIYNYISYRTLDANGNPLGEVMDINMDGQPDFKSFDHDKGERSQVWINKEWHELSKLDGKPAIVQNGKFLPVELTKNGWQVKKSTANN